MGRWMCISSFRIARWGTSRPGLRSFAAIPADTEFAFSPDRAGLGDFQACPSGAWTGCVDFRLVRLRGGLYPAIFESLVNVL